MAQAGESFFGEMLYTDPVVLAWARGQRAGDMEQHVKKVGISRYSC